MENLSSQMSLFSMFLNSDIVVKVVIVLLIIVSVWSWSIIFSKWSKFRLLKFQFTRFEKAFWSSEALNILYEKVKRRKNNPIVSVFVAAMEEWYLCKDEETKGNIAQGMTVGLKERVHKVMSVTRNRELDNMEKGLGFLATVSSTSPFVGLFGTVWGIMNSFTAIAAMNNVSLAVVAPGIAEALLTTAMGLIAAIPAAIAYNHFEGELNRFAGAMEDFSEEFNTLLSRQVDIKVI